MSQAAFRIYKSDYAETAMTGSGASRYGGRWNHKGTAVVYCSSSLSLAQLEQLAHLNGPMPPTGFEWFEIGIPKRCFMKRRRLSLADLGQYGFDWKSDPPHSLLQEIGTEWVNSGESLVMDVPSVVNPIESNFLINPAHPDFDKLRLKPAATLEWDRRLFEWGE